MDGCEPHLFKCPGRGNPIFCLTCGENKPCSSFSSDKMARHGHRTKCKHCHNREKRVAASTRRCECGHPAVGSRIRCSSCITLHRHGVDYKWYCETFTKQGGVCAICQKLPKDKLEVDHDHECCPGHFGCIKCVRSLTCSDCNTLIGRAKDSPYILERAARYLREHGKRLWLVK